MMKRKRPRVRQDREADDDEDGLDDGVEDDEHERGPDEVHGLVVGDGRDLRDEEEAEH